MSVTRIAVRYARSLLDLAIEQDKLDRVREDISVLSAALEVRDLYLLMKSPIVHGSSKKQVLDRLFSDRFDPLTKAFIDIIIRKSREPLLPEIVSGFVGLYKEYKDIATVRLTTAREVPEGILEEIRQKVGSSAVTRANVDLETKIDPKIIGGFVLEFDDKLYNASVAYRLEQMRKGFNGRYIKSTTD